METTSEKSEPPSPKGEHADDAAAIIQRHALWAIGVGVVPVPIIDLIGVTGVQIKMLRDLSDLYSVPFEQPTATDIVAGLIGSLGAIAGASILASLIKVIPIVGQTAGAVTLPLTAGATTQALGKIFAAHFEAGGTFHDLEISQVQDHFRREFEKAKTTLNALRRDH